MSIHIDDFWKPSKLIVPPSENDYKSISTQIDTIKAFSKVAYQGAYIIDYYRREFLFVSDNSFWLCGNLPETVRTMGYSFYLKYVPEEDLKLLLEINDAFFSFYKDVSIANRINYSISYDFHLNRSNNYSLLINHKLTPLTLDKSSNIWLAIAVVSLSSNKKSGNIFIGNPQNQRLFQYDIEDKRWHPYFNKKLTKAEKNILILSSQGRTTEDIAQILFTSTRTIKFHRANILRKLGVDNIAEAVIYVINYKLI